MSRLNWNFAQPRGHSLLWLAICIVALSGCVHALWWRDALLKQREYLVEHMQHASHQAAGREHRLVAPPSAALAQVFTEMHYPWTEMLDSLQRATTPTLDLLTLEPDAGSSRQVHISGVATRAQDVFDLIVALRNGCCWSSVQLLSQAKNDDPNLFRTDRSAPPGLPGTGQTGVSFSLVAQWSRP